MASKKEKKTIIKEEPTKPVGRPTDYSIKLIDTICERIAGGESIRGICKDESMPATTTVFRWLASEEHKYFREQYAIARVECGNTEFDEIKDIIDAKPEYYYDEKGNRRIDTGWIQLQRLRADKRQWRASKLTPKKYGYDITLSDDTIKAIIDIPRRESREEWIKNQK